jgi:phosphopantetheinyl transferase
VKAESFPITVQPPPFFRDHHVRNQPVLAAVEAMERLVADTCLRFPENNGRRLKDIRFNKFLRLDTQAPFKAFNRVEQAGDGSIRATLATRFKAPGATITRTLDHTSLTLDKAMPSADGPPLDAVACLTGLCDALDPARIYRELVPFGPAYQTICEPLLISAEGALARVRSPQSTDPRRDLRLGSPYVLDAAFHAACVWCQCFRGIVAFPVSMDRRTVIRPTRMDEVYTVRVVPGPSGDAACVFDIFVYDDNGELHEAANGVRMRDVSGGRNTPPQGFRRTDQTDPLFWLRKRVAGLVLLERSALATFAAAALSGNEMGRLTSMTADRARGYLSARLVLKRLSRMLSGDGDRRPSREIETVAGDGRAPQCPLADGTRPHCTVSHDRRFTVAVAADDPVGVDVEPLSDMPLKATHLFMDSHEQAMVDHSPLGAADAALRVWSTKEAAAKALGINLAEAWAKVRVIDVAAAGSRLVSTDGRQLTATHASVENHLFTLLTVEGRI